MNLDRNEIKRSIIQSQHCQRNWDLSKQIPEEDIETIIANMMGYNTGYCACFDDSAVQKILGISNKIMSMLGIGYKNENIDRKIHQIRRYVYPTKIKQEIKVDYYD